MKKLLRSLVWAFLLLAAPGAYAIGSDAVADKQANTQAGCKVALKEEGAGEGEEAAESEDANPQQPAKQEPCVDWTKLDGTEKVAEKQEEEKPAPEKGIWEKAYDAATYIGGELFGITSAEAKMAQNVCTSTPGGMGSDICLRGSLERDYSVPRSYDTNNPGAVNDSALAKNAGYMGSNQDKWGNKTAVFATPEYGFQYYFDQIERKIDKGSNTLSSLLYSYSGAGRAKEAADYVASVSQMTGMSPNTVLDFNNQQQMTSLATAMLRHESGKPMVYTQAQVAAGYQLAQGGNTSAPAQPAYVAAPSVAAPAAAAPSFVPQRVAQAPLPQVTSYQPVQQPVTLTPANNYSYGYGGVNPMALVGAVAAQAVASGAGSSQQQARPVQAQQQPQTSFLTTKAYKEATSESFMELLKSYPKAPSAQLITCSKVGIGSQTRQAEQKICMEKQA